jgi:hypothetical protein
MRNTLLFIMLAFLLGSCTKDLKPIDYSAINPTDFPKNYKDVQAMVNACYYPVRGAWYDGINSTSERGLMMMEASQTGILDGAFDPSLSASTMNYTPNSTGITYFYDNFHSKISMMTTYINTISTANIDITDAQRKQAIAEIRCVRGLLCLDLFNLYGPIVVAPLSALQNPLQGQPLARLSNDSMEAFIEADLQAAVRGLPSPPDAEYGRFSTGLARMLLIRLYLHEKKWTNVLAECDTIIDHHYYALDPDYVGMWGLNGAKNSPEVIWAIPCDYAGTSENQWQMMALPSNYPGYPGWGSIQSSWWFYDSFEPGDVRKTRLISHFTGTDGIEYDRNNPGLLLNYGPLPLKIDPDANRTTALSTVDIIEYRYADVLLSKAEAIANINGAPDQEAMDLVNMIRERAGIEDYKLSDYSALPEFIDMLLTERSHEFWCENGEYRQDLIRYGKLVDRVKMITKSSYAQEYKVLWPFSLQNIIEGKGKFIQNPGYD